MNQIMSKYQGKQAELKNELVNTPLTQKQVLKMAQEYKETKAELVKMMPEAICFIGKVGQKKPYLRKSGIRWLATHAGISTKIVNHEKDRHGKDSDKLTWRFWVLATAPNGRQMEAVGACCSDERKKDQWYGKMENDCMTIAQTRATNRAVLDLLGGGDVSAEEMESETE